MPGKKRQPATTVGQIRRQRTRRRLLEAARLLFARLGYEGTTVDDIAREAGYSKGAYYFHFASKEDALLALVDAWADSRSRRLRAAAGGRLPEAALARLLEALTSDEGTEDARLAVEFWSQAERNPKLRRRLQEAYRSWREVLVRALARAKEAGILPLDAQPVAVAEAALSFGDGLLVRRAVAAPTSATAGAEALAALSATLRAAESEGERAVPAAM